MTNIYSNGRLHSLTPPALLQNQAALLHNVYAMHDLGVVAALATALPASPQTVTCDNVLETLSIGRFNCRYAQLLSIL